MFILQNERLEEFYEFLDPFQVAVSSSQRRLLQRQRSSNSLDGLDNRALRRRRHQVVPLFRNWNRVETQTKPGLHTFLGAIVFAMRKRCKFDRTPHVAWIRH